MRFYRSHIDAVLYDFAPPCVPQGPPQTYRYNDGMGDALYVLFSTTTFVSDKMMLDILARAL